jgi:ferredoxin
MPKITVKDGQSFEVDAGTRLVLALQDNDVDILHLCGGHARCTTCRVKVHDGEPSKMTVAEKERLGKDDGLLGEVRLSCQIPCDADMTVEPLMRVSTTEHDAPGKRPEDHITPEPEWTDAP